MGHRVLIVVSLFLLTLTLHSKDSYHFVSIEGLVEQEVGRIVLPEIYKKLNLKIATMRMPGLRAEKELRLGKCDGEVMRIYSYGEDNPHVLRVPTPYYYLDTTAFVRKNHSVKINTQEDLKELSVIIIRGVKHTQNMTHGLSNVFETNSGESMMRYLQKGRADVALTNSLNGYTLLERLALEDIVAIKKPLDTLALYHYVHKDHEALVPLINNVIQEMQESGELDVLINNAQEKVLQRTP